MTPILELHSVSKSFGALLVINKVSLQVEKGEIIGILGPNGAGKTTLLNLISGDLPVDSGEILFQREWINAVPTARRCHLGIGRTNQIPKPFEGMTVLENVLVGATYGQKQKQKDGYEISMQVLELTGLVNSWNKLAGNLRLLERKRLELARTLATKPSLLLLDEIAGGLTDHEVPELLAVIRKLHDQGTTIVWIEHIVHALVSAADRIVAIDFGSILADDTPTNILNNPAFKEIYLGVETEPIRGRE
jgi:branched-chain amino acid transport system ATP-binding protein